MKDRGHPKPVWADNFWEALYIKTADIRTHQTTRKWWVYKRICRFGG